MDRAKKETRRIGLAFCFLVFLFTSVGPSPARAGFWTYDPAYDKADSANWAQRAAKWAEQFSVLTELISAVTWLTESIGIGAEAVSTKIKTGAAMMVASSKINEEIKNRQTDSAIDAKYAASYMEAAAEAAIENTPPQNAQLCNNLVLQEGVLRSDDFRRVVSRWAMSSAHSMGVGEGADNSGPAYAASVLGSLFEMKFLEKVDGVSDEYIDDTKGTDGRALSGAYLRGSVDGGQVYEFPAMEKKKINGLERIVPAPENMEQKFWVAEYYHCLSSLGASPTPPQKAEILSPEGIVKRAHWEHCTALQSAAFSACIERLAFYTRPNKSYAALIESQKQEYKAIGFVGLEQKETFGDGSSGLSPYQSLLAAHAACKANQYMTDLVGSGATTAEAANAIDECTAAWATMESFRAALDQANVTASAALAKMPECWRDVE